MKRITEIISWLEEAAGQIRASLATEITVAEKSSRNDLVTNIDQETQRFLIEKIQAYDPQAKILAEEDGYTEEKIQQGRVYVIDPIDGTLNFVLEKANFCIMLAVFEEGVGQLGFIFDVMRNELYWGSRQLGVFCNDQKLPQPDNTSLADGLLGMNAYMYGNDRHQAYKIGETSMGVRCSGCAGIEMIAMIKGQHVGYVSNLSPWDYAAGIVLLDCFGFCYSGLAGPLKFNGREYFFAGTPRAYEEMQGILHQG